jgi:hypothetical protein
LGIIKKEHGQNFMSTLKGAIIMSKKWLLTLSGSLLAAMIVTGCADDQDPAPPEDTNEQLPDENGDSPVDENLDENMDPEGAEGPEEGANDGTNEGAENEELMEEEGTADPENGTTDGGNNEGIDEGMTNPEDENKKE